MADVTSSQPSVPTPARDLPVTTSQIHDAQGICRICRGEGTLAEPLFYPCKCSGSIKYVHQDCLMEWLAHSQKKHCELCKTSFRFTKLYAPNMPARLPVHVFVEHAAKHLIRETLVLLRVLLAVSVWIFWLPFIMRWVWSFMFWISDEGLVNHAAGTGAGSLGRISHEQLRCAAPGQESCPSTPLYLDGTTPGVVAGAIVKGLASQDLSTLLKRLALACVGIRYRPQQASSALASTVQREAPSSSSLFSSTILARDFAGNGSGSLRRAAASILEGQVITVLVILSFILVILVRDYVIQQQPEINMRAAFEEDAAPAAVPDADAPGAAPLPDPAAVRAPPQNQAHHAYDSDSDAETLDNSDAASNNESAPVAHDLGATVTNISDVATITEPTEPVETPGNSNSHVAQDVRATVKDYVRIYSRAAGNPQRILELIEEEGLQEPLKYWVEITKKALDSKSPGSLVESLPHEPTELDASSRSSEETSTGSRRMNGESSASAARLDVSEEDDTQAHHTVHEGASKGKERELPSTPLGLDAQPLAASTSSPRPRSQSDGPPIKAAVNPLANNNWTFDGLSESIEPRTSENAMHHEKTDTSETPVRNVADRPLDGVEPARVVENADAGVQTLAAGPRTSSSSRSSQHPQGSETVGSNGEPPQEGIVGMVANYMWADIEQVPPAIDSDDEDEPAEADQARGQDAGWMDVPMAQAVNDIVENEADEIDIGADGAPAAEVVDDLDDFDGIMELVGLRGPIAGLFQNAIFCAVLVSATILSCIFFPYNIGRITLWTFANPMRLVRMLFVLSKLIQDVAVCAGAFLSWCFLNFVDVAVRPFGKAMFEKVVLARKGAWAVWMGSASRVFSYLFKEGPISPSEMQNFSAVSHQALYTVKEHFYQTLMFVPRSIAHVRSQNLRDSLGQIACFLQAVPLHLKPAMSTLMKPRSWVIHFKDVEYASVVDVSLASWSASDRFWAVFAGYSSIILIGALYLKRGTPFARGGIMEAWETGVLETLQQASGIMKVILVISIEMLTFPLYCGLLLDVALLPLFQGATLKSRLLFTYNFPLTSVFVHWFVGTGYMFHFALFVSMCRKIMRPGVLYFIRDPDDPEFHPVRDVLERNLTIQLRKILFSAFVYGALVIVCLGGVVWGMAFALPTVLPIHYSSNEPIIEFPVDLLFYNFFVPLAINFFEPSESLQMMYTWWFRRCARALRLTYFLFGERRIDEEGTLHLLDDSPHNATPGYRKILLELGEDNLVVPKTWRDTFEGSSAKPSAPLGSRKMRELRYQKAVLVESGQLAKDGRFVRAPASDRVKIPKGKRVFLTVTERDHRQDDRPDDDLYASSQYQIVYIPPNFRGRIFAFIMMIWVFAAITGLGFTILPLILGRRVFQGLIPVGIRTNDIYAFSIGICLLGSVTYVAFHLRSLWQTIKAYGTRAKSQLGQTSVFRSTWRGMVASAKVVYAYTFIAIVFPLVASMLMELYIILPLQTVLSSPSNPFWAENLTKEHTIRLVESWTLGLLYVKLASKAVTSLQPGSRLANATRSVMRRGWLRPNVSVLTRAFVVPGLALAVLAICGPPLMLNMLWRLGLVNLGRLGPNVWGLTRLDRRERVQAAYIYRMTYPFAMAFAIQLRGLFELVRFLQWWTARIRDEAYLIGERLHNFGATPGTGDKKGSSSQAIRATGPRL